MKFNVNKCSILQLSIAKHHHKSKFPYSMAGERLSTVDQHSYLGVQLDLTTISHGDCMQINYVCSKATRTPNFLRRNLQNCPKNLKKSSYKQFVLPVLEYTAKIWDLYHQNYVSKIEMIQHRAACFVLSRPWRRNASDSVSLLLHSLGWPTLQLRRKCTRLILMYKLLNNLLSHFNLILCFSGTTDPFNSLEESK